MPSPLTCARHPHPTVLTTLATPSVTALLTTLSSCFLDCLVQGTESPQQAWRVHCSPPLPTIPSSVPGPEPAPCKLNSLLHGCWQPGFMDKEGLIKVQVLGHERGPGSGPLLPVCHSPRGLDNMFLYQLWYHHPEAPSVLTLPVFSTAPVGMEMNEMPMRSRPAIPV